MSDTAEIQRRIALLESEVEGENKVSRHILRKVSDNEALLLEMKRDLGALRDELVLLRADMPGIIAGAVGALLREIQSKRAG
jgi:hypothetical protein